MEAVLVAGGAGYIGSHVAKMLAKEGYQPVVLDNLTTGNEWAVRWGPLVVGDIADSELVRQTIDTYKVEAVIHLAASAYVGESVLNPRKYYENNVMKSLAFLGAMMDSGVRRIVFSSTCAVYGDSSVELIDESHPRVPVNPYGESKLFVETALRGLASAGQLNSVCLRYFNAAGADPEGEIGECHFPETHLIPLALESALDSDRILAVFGADYLTEDGTAIRDYTHVHDLARAHILALRYLNRGGHSVSLNLGNGKGHSVFEVARTVTKVSGHQVATKSMARRPGDPPKLVADPGAAIRTLGWQPVWPDLEHMIEHAWTWRTVGFEKMNRSRSSDPAFTAPTDQSTFASPASARFGQLN